MRYTQVGGMEVSQLALGTWHLPPDITMDRDGVLDVDVETTNKIFSKAMDLGINFFDTANTYHGTISETHLHPEHSGNAEVILGNFISGIERESIVIATKVRAEVARFPNGGGLSRKHVAWQIKESLKRLKTDHVDLYQIHWQDKKTDPEETMDILNDIVHQGKSNYIGVSNHPPDVMERMLNISGMRGWEKFVSVQEPYNFLDRSFEAFKAGIASKNKLTLLAYVPLAEGILTGKYMNGIPAGTRGSYTDGFKDRISETRNKVELFVQVAKEMDVEPAQLAIAWILEMQRYLGIRIVPIMGATSVKHLESNVEALDIKVTEDTMKRLNSL
ncbi:MAG: aldo/keto reductase [Thermoplasmataceae archaeon]